MIMISNIIIFIIMTVNIIMLVKLIGVQVEYKLEMARGFVKKGEEARLVKQTASLSSLSSSSLLSAEG